MNPSLNTLFGKHILLGITGGIAAYKSAELTRRLRDAGAQVRVVMTRSATEFVTPLTFQALSGHAVHTELLDETAEAGMGHIALARWADAVLIAPASANTLARLAQGRGDDLLTTLCLATEAPIAYAPSMNRVMWNAQATRANCETLLARGYTQLGPASGAQACGETGEGRMLEVDQLVAAVAAMFNSGALQTLRVVMTAGPTYEPIDPVRFIGNRSSGRMGFALAQAARDAGAAVTLIAGPCALPTPADVNRVDVETAAEMLAAVQQQLSRCDIFIATAAVADYRPAEIAAQKIKKHSEQFMLELVRNPDILASVAGNSPRPFVVGFAAETENLEQHALDKLRRKQLDMIAANDVSAMGSAEQDIGFGSEYNALQVFWPGGQQVLPRARKHAIATQLVQLIAHHYRQNNHAKDSA
jgi:phosphopantothenoylcysteine decarboxylase/phosphopantothenate--cysteine ligase